MARKRNAALKSDSVQLLNAALLVLGTLQEWHPGSVALSHASMSLTMAKKDIDAMEVPSAPVSEADAAPNN